MNAELVCVGTELLLGQIVNTNASYLAEHLAHLGVNLYHISTVGDNLSRLADTLRLAWRRSDLLIISGGLGPTLDDLTREAIALLLEEELVEDPVSREMIEGYFKRVGRSMSANNLRQAKRPQSAQLLPNPLGTAPGLWVEKTGKIVVALPGVPVELKNLMTREVIPRLKEKLGTDSAAVLVSKVLKVVGVGESVLEERIKDLLDAQINPTIAPLAHRGEVTLRITAKAPTESAAALLISPVEEEIRNRLAGHVYGVDQETLEEVIGKRLAECQLTLGVAESCTGGLIGHRITEAPGASTYFILGIVAYHNRIKTDLLGVDQRLLKEHGAVSPQVAKAMAEGMRMRYGVDLALSTTGIAGPGGGTVDKPTGLVYLGLAHASGTVVRKMNYLWNRTENKIAAAQGSLVLLWQYLTDGLQS